MPGFSDMQSYPNEIIGCQAVMHTRILCSAQQIAIPHRRRPFSIGSPSSTTARSRRVQDTEWQTYQFRCLSSLHGTNLSRFTGRINSIDALPFHPSML
jgi:hypothetical protein